MAHVVVAEDDPDVHELLSMILDVGGHEVRMTHSGDAALAACLAEPPELVMLDVSMPGELDGYAVARRLRVHPATKDLPIIMLTAHAQEDAERKALAAGANAYLVKPFDAERLLELIERLLGVGDRRA